MFLAQRVIINSGRVTILENSKDNAIENFCATMLSDTAHELISIFMFNYLVK